METLSIGALAKTAGVSVETVRFYQRRGLLAEPTKPYGGIRRYDETHVTRLHFVKSAQRLGFSLAEVEQLLQLNDGVQCQQASVLAEQKLKEVHEKITDLAQIEIALSSLLEACHTRQDAVSCPLIAALQNSSDEQTIKD
ncbi:Hg(II)-responsive transcriptional regulator [Salinisphaera orenii]|uniref:Hg(II)-responsive transcriptional regulator n=1 Tax=Salinisphaera orenii TaxID=856731 RepID=UPI000DBE5470